MPEMSEELEDYLRKIFAIHPQIQMMAKESGITNEAAIDAAIELLRKGVTKMEDGPQGFKMVPNFECVPQKPKKRRLFRV